MGLLAAFVAKKITKTKPWTIALVIVAIAAIFLHIGADFLNNYGIHPFTPFSNRWHYGDSIYIVEPLIWFSLLPIIAREAEKSWARLGWWMLALTMITLVWIFPTFNVALSSSLTFYLIVCILLVYPARSAIYRIGLTTALFTAVIGTFYYCGSLARTLARTHWENSTLRIEKWTDTASTPTPGNPLCWNIWVATRSSDAFHFYSAKVSLWPTVLPAAECDPRPTTAHTSDLTQSTFPTNRAIQWIHESRLSFQDWESMRSSSPTFRKFISFARFPYIKKLPAGEVIIGDLRYDRQTSLGFAEIKIAPEEMGVPMDGPWDEPVLRNDSH